MSVLKGEVKVAEAARRLGVTEQTISNWRRQFLEAGAAGIEQGKRQSKSQREAQLEAEVEELKTALGETVAELRVVKRGRSTREILYGSK
ncbi:MAG: helix-turn-helix domain-containing protein [Myxococcales bacterium]|nr:helix-turn-helix domain-containing protein [Myxococcales bacterium]